MDSDVLVQKALECMEREDFARAKVYLKRAASQAPLRSDIREMLQYVLEVSPSAENRQVGKSSFGQPRSRRSLGLLITTAVALVLLGAALGAFLRFSGLVRMPADGTGRDATTPRTAMEIESDEMAGQGLYARAIELLEQAREENPESTAHINARIAFWYETLGRDLENTDLTGAIAHLVKAARADPDNANLHARLGNLLLRRARAGEQGAARSRTLEQAADSLREALRIEPEHLQALYDLALVEATANRRAEAVALFNKLVELAPESPQAKQAERQLTSMQVRQP